MCVPFSDISGTSIGTSGSLAVAPCDTAEPWDRDLSTDAWAGTAARDKTALPTTHNNKRLNLLLKIFLLKVIKLF